MRIYTFDTTLRDGTQGEAVSFSVDDKLLIAQKLDELGIDYIEGGWPGSNPKDKEFFARARDLTLAHAQADGVWRDAVRASTASTRTRASRALVEAGTPVVSIFGKTWDFHVRRALGISLDENLALIAETVKYLKDHGKEVVYDAEHFFDGYTRQSATTRCGRSRPRTAAGADVLCLCDTNGGTQTGRVARDRGRRPPALRRRHRHPHAQRLRRRPWPTRSRRSKPAPRTCRAA